MQQFLLLGTISMMIMSTMLQQASATTVCDGGCDCDAATNYCDYRCGTTDACTCATCTGSCVAACPAPTAAPTASPTAAPTASPLTEAESCLATCSACFEPFQPNLKALAGGVIAEMSGPNAASALSNFAVANQAAVGAAAQLQDGNGASCASMEASGCLTTCLPSAALGVFDPPLTEAYQATDCNSIGAVECSRCICFWNASPCSAEDRTWCDANLMTGNNCNQYSICPQDAAAGNTGGGGGDGDKAVVAENTVTVEVKTLQITIKADVDLSKLNAADLKKFADAGKAMALAAGVPADQIKDIKYFQEVLNADGTSKDPKELKEIKAPTSRRARRALFFGPITFEIVFKDTATVDLANLAEKVNVAIVQGNVPFTVELSTGKLTGKVNKAEMVVVEVKDDGIVVPVSGSSTTAFAAGLIATLAAVATIV